MYLTEEEFLILFLKALKAKKNRNMLEKSPRRLNVSLTEMSPVPPLRGSPRLPTLRKGSGLSSLSGVSSSVRLPPSPRSSMTLPPSPRSVSYTHLTLPTILLV